MHHVIAVDSDPAEHDESTRKENGWEGSLEAKLKFRDDHEKCLA